MPGVGVHGGDHPILGHPPRDPEHVVRAFLQVLAQHRGQQRRRLPDRVGKPATIQQREHREPIASPGVDQLLTSGPVVPVDLRLAVAGVVVPAAQPRPQRGGQLGIGDGEQPPHRRADQRDGVHRGHRVIQRGRVQHPPPPHQSGRGRRLQPHLEDPVRSCRIAQSSAHVHQHRVREPGPARAVPADPGGVAPAHVEGVPVDRLPVRKPVQPLQHHHRGHHRWRHAGPPAIAEQIGEQLVGKQPVPLPRQEPVDRVLRQRLLAEPGRIVEQVDLAISTPQRHPEILPRRTAEQGNQHAKDTSLLYWYLPSPVSWAHPT